MVQFECPGYWNPSVSSIFPFFTPWFASSDFRAVVRRLLFCYSCEFAPSTSAQPVRSTPFLVGNIRVVYFRTLDSDSKPLSDDSDQSQDSQSHDFPLYDIICYFSLHLSWYSKLNVFWFNIGNLRGLETVMIWVINDLSHHPMTLDSDSLFRNRCNGLRLKSRDSRLVYSLISCNRVVDSTFI